MKRKYWIIVLSVLALVVIGGAITVLVMNAQNASAPSSDNKTTTGPLTVYYIAIDDNGKSGAKVGCGDSAVATKTASVTTDNVVKSTFENLIANHNQYIGESGLYNVLYKSNLAFVSSSKTNDTVTVKLTGSLGLGGTCDNPRVQAELEMSAKTAAGVSKANIFLNDKPLSEVLSLK